MQSQAEAVPKFQFVRDELMLLPYFPTVGVYKADTLLKLYDRLHEEDLWSVVFHENPEMSLNQFVGFFNETSNLLQILSIVEGDNILDTAGMAWVSGLVDCAGALVRGHGSFVFFRNWQKPHYTDRFAKIILEYWFTALNLDLVMGVTPTKNRAALAFVKRNGFETIGYAKDFTSFDGKPDDAVISVMHKKEFLGGNNG